MSDPKVEEIRARLATKFFEEALNANALLAAAEERERTLIAGVRELSDYMNEPTGKNEFYVNGFANRYDSLRDLYDEKLPNRIEAILSRLLPSTPTEEN